MSARTDLCGGYRAIGIPTAIPEMSMKTKGRTTTCPTQKTTFLHSCTLFALHFSKTACSFVAFRPAERIRCFKMQKRPSPEALRAYGIRREFFFDVRSRNVTENK